MSNVRWGLLLCCLASCSRTTNLANSADAAPASTDAGAQFEISDAGVVFCGNAPCACSNGLDDDGDGLIDGFDPECTGAADNDEASFATGLRGEDRSGKCAACFFDGKQDTGNDPCRRATSCGTTGSIASP